MCFEIVRACFSSSAACFSSSLAIDMYCAPLSTCEYTTYAMMAWYSRDRSWFKCFDECLSRVLAYPACILHILTIVSWRCCGRATFGGSSVRNLISEATVAVTIAGA